MRLFVYYSLLRPDFRARAAGFATGTTVLALPRDAVEAFQVVVPSINLIQAFNALVRPLIELRWSLDRQSATLATLRDTLLPRLLSGELRIRDADDSPLAPSSAERLLASALDR